jgi:hypothetical protein
MPAHLLPPLPEQKAMDFRDEINLEDKCIHEPIKGS